MTEQPEAHWHTVFASLFGRVGPSEEMAVTWTAVWASKGYTNAEAIEAVRALLALHPTERPEFPLQWVDRIEATMRRNKIAAAAAGKIPVDSIRHLLPDYQKDLAERSKAIRQSGLPFHTPESLAYARDSQQLRSITKALNNPQITRKESEPCQVLANPNP